MAITPTTSGTTSATTPTSGSTTGSALSGIGSKSPTHVDGLVSGIQSGNIIDALMQSAGAATQVLVGRQTVLKNRVEAVRTLNTKLLTAQLDLASLRQSSTFLARSVDNSSPAVLSATASSSAAVGSYSVNVQLAAQAQQLSTAGFASATGSLGTGTVTIGLGAAGATTLTLDASNSSLNGLASAINSAGIGIKAQVINDGSATPWRLVLTSTRTGAANAITFDATGLSGSGSAALQPVVTTAKDVSSTSSVALSGAFTGASGPPQYLVQVDHGGTVGTDATFKWSKDGGTTWTSGVAATAGAVALSDGVSATFRAGTLTTGDAFTLQPMQQLAAAQDSVIKYGTGTSQISITSASNTIANLIPGVTLNLKGTGTTTLTVANDASIAKDAISTFVKDLNGAIKYLADNSRYDAGTNQGGILIADSSLRSGVDQLINSLTGVVGASGSSVRTLTDLGITLDDHTGEFKLDQATLTKALDADADGVKALFSDAGKTSDPRVTFATMSAATRTDISHTIAITRAATQAVATTSAIVGSPTGTVTIAAGANQLDLTVNGTAVRAKLTAGTYTLAQLADGLQTAINASFGGAQIITVAASGTQLDLRSRNYGSSQAIVVQPTSTALTALGIAAGTYGGVDVAGTIDGVAGVGTGQALAGASGSPAEGLQIVSTATTPVANVTMTLRKGLGEQAEEAFKSLTDVSIGTVVSDEDALNARVDDISGQIVKQNTMLAATRLRLEAQFHQMEKLIQQFNSQGNLLTQQILGFQNLAKGG